MSHYPTVERILTSPLSAAWQWEELQKLAVDQSKPLAERAHAIKTIDKLLGCKPTDMTDAELVEDYWLQCKTDGVLDLLVEA